MDVDEALLLLGLPAGATPQQVRASYRRLVRRSHPDLVGDDPAATERTARLTEAYAVVRAALAGVDAADARREPGPARSHTDDVPTAERDTAGPGDPALDVDVVDHDSLLVLAPADEAFAALFEAAGRIGHVAYFDRHLGIVETIVRFEGGPSCSVLATLQGRAQGTEVFLTMESIEAGPTPPIAPVVTALLAALAGST